MITLTEGKIIDQWSTMIAQCHGHSEALLQGVEANLKASEAPPGVNWKRESVAPGWLKGLFGKRRDFLLVSNERFDDYLMCIGARDYGTALDVSWYLTGSAKSAVVKALSQAGGGLFIALPLDVFDPQDLAAYVTVGHHAMLKAVEDLMRERKLDLARLERNSRGMFAVA